MTEHGVLPNGADEALLAILDDYDHQAGFFEDLSGEVEDEGLQEDLDDLRAMGVIDSDREAALYVTLSLTLNYQKDTDRLGRQMRGLRQHEPWIFDPETLVGDDRFEQLDALFNGTGQYSDHPVIEEHGVLQHRSQDAAYWYTVADTLHRRCDGDVATLLDQFDHDATQLFDHVQSARRETPAHEAITTTKRFPGLGGDKAAKLWLRAVHDLIASLDNIALLPIPVDTHIETVTNRLVDREYSITESESDKEEIRELYREFCQAYDRTATRVDRPLWLIGKQWSDGEQSYLKSKLD